jgi:antitoxin VapB
MIRTRVFLNDGTQAVRLPKPVALDDNVHQVTVVVVGRARVIAPVGESWDSWFNGPGVTPDFMPERDQPATEQWDAL